jgi:hypothetical protein
MPQSLGRLIFFVVIEFPKRFVAGKLNEDRASFHEVAFEVFRSVYSGNQAAAVFLNQLENGRHIFIIVSLLVVNINEVVASFAACLIICII